MDFSDLGLAEMGFYEMDCAGVELCEELCNEDPVQIEDATYVAKWHARLARRRARLRARSRSSSKAAKKVDARSMRSAGLLSLANLASFTEKCKQYRLPRSGDSEASHPDVPDGSKIPAEAYELLKANIEDTNVDELADDEERAKYYEQLKFAVAAQKDLNRENEAEIAELRTQMIDAGQCLASEYGWAHNLIGTPNGQFDELRRIIYKWDKKPYLKAETRLCERMKLLAHNRRDLQLRIPGNLAEAWDVAAGLIEVLQEDKDLMEETKLAILRCVDGAEQTIRKAGQDVYSELADQTGPP